MCQRVNMASEGVDMKKLTENNAVVTAVEPEASASSTTDGQDRLFESARDATTDSNSLSASPVENLEAGFYKV